MRKLLASSLLLLPTALAAVEEFPVEVHGFTSLGYLLTDGNEYAVDDSSDGTTEFWEFAVNASWQPADAWRLAGQVFARDYGRYDNGRVQLDWLFAEYRDRDAIGVQMGRVKQIVGLYGDALDVDSARVPVLLPNSVYPRILRDTLLAIDGAKVSGFLHLGGAGSLEYAAWGGNKTTDIESSTGRTVRDLVGEDAEIDDSLGAGAMLHWNTPVDGLGLRLSGSVLGDFEIRGRDDTGFPAIDTTLEIDHYPVVTVSAIYEREDWTFAAEIQRYFARGDVTATADGFGVVLEDEYKIDTAGGYLSATWHARDRLQLYAALDLVMDRPGSTSDPEDYQLAYVLAGRYDLTDHWLIKAEVNRIDGYLWALEGEDGGDFEDDWWLVALKTTVDF